MTDADPGGPRAWGQWVLAVSFVVFVFALQTSYAITNASVAADLTLTLAQVGFVGSVYTWVFAFAQTASGSVLDRIGARWVLPIACLIASLGALLFANADGVAVLLSAQVLLAIGASYGFIGAGFVGGEWFGPIRYGLMFSFVQFVGSLSAIAGQRLLGALIETTDWRVLITRLALSGLGLAAMLSLFLRRPASYVHGKWPGGRGFGREVLAALGTVVSIRETWLNALIGGATMGTMLGIGVVWGPRILAAGGMAEAEAFRVSSLAWAGLAFGAPLFAWLSDRTRRRVGPMALGCGAQLTVLSIILFRLDASPAELSVWFAAFGFLAGGSMLSFTIGMELVPPRLTGTSAAVVNATQFIVGGIMMAVPGQVLAGVGPLAGLARRFVPASSAAIGTSMADHQWAMAIMPLTLGLGLLLCRFLRDTYPTVER